MCHCSDLLIYRICLSVVIVVIEEMRDGGEINQPRQCFLVDYRDTQKRVMYVFMLICF